MAENHYNREMDKSDRVTSIITLWACWTSEAAEVIGSRNNILHSDAQESLNLINLYLSKHDYDNISDIKSVSQFSIFSQRLNTELSHQSEIVSDTAENGSKSCPNKLNHDTSGRGWLNWAPLGLEEML